MFKTLFSKETQEQRFEKRVNEVFQGLIKVEDKGFTELETVQICNSVKRKLNEYLEERKAHCVEQSIHFNQRAVEINNALEHLE
jgi:hypothetical protein